MAFVANKNQQISLVDSIFSITDRERNILKKGWSEAFSRHIFPMINEDRFAVLFSDNPASRPNTPVNVIVGMMILKEIYNHTDDDLLEEVLFDIRYQNALHTTSFTEQPVSDRTLSRFRARLYDYEQQTSIDLMKEEMESLADAFVEMMKISGQTKRMDSLMVASSCKKMSRLELVYRCVSRMVKAIQATGETALLDKRLQKYLDADDENDTLYRTPSSEAGSKLEAALTDALRLLALTGEAYGDLSEYQQLKRLAAEQTEETEQGWKLREKISPQSLQNPSDEDATYREKAGKKHKGYVGNFVETFDEKGAIITGMDYAPNTRSDIAFSRSVIEAEQNSPEQPVTILADGAYGSDELVALAKQNHVNLITTALIGKTPDPVMSEFVIDEKMQAIASCPAGQAPIVCQYKVKTDSYYAHFNKGTCSTCPLRHHCGVKFQKKTGLVHISGKSIRRAAYLKRLGKPEYKKLTRLRNAVEGIPSVLRRKYRVDNMPVRGYVRSKLWYFLKIGAMNTKRVLEWAKEQGSLIRFDLCCAYSNFFRSKIRMRTSQLILTAVF
ncbi:MAG: transposase [Clostridia bacterium]|nr:transposase [Clostridia bacterium]